MIPKTSRTSRPIAIASLVSPSMRRRRRRETRVSGLCAGRLRRSRSRAAARTARCFVERVRRRGASLRGVGSARGVGAAHRSSKPSLDQSSGWGGGPCAPSDPPFEPERAPPPFRARCTRMRVAAPCDGRPFRRPGRRCLNAVRSVLYTGNRWHRRRTPVPAREGAPAPAHGSRRASCVLGRVLNVEHELIGVSAKSNSGQLGGRTWRSRYGVCTVRTNDTYLRGQDSRPGWGLPEKGVARLGSRRGVAKPGYRAAFGAPRLGGSNPPTPDLRRFESADLTKP